MVSRSISLPSSGFFSSFPHGTSSLSVSREYLGLEGGPPRFRQGFTCPVLLRILTGRYSFWVRDFHSLWCDFPDTSPNLHGPSRVLQPRHACTPVWPIPRSLAATSGISVDLFSSGYLDVSVPPVCSYSATLLTLLFSVFPPKGLPHSETPGSKPAGRLPKVIAA